MRGSRHTSVASLLLLGLGCSSPSRVCTPGAQVSCACPGSTMGVQVCAADGQSLGSCKCSSGTGGGSASGGGSATGGGSSTGGGSAAGGGSATGGGAGGGGGSACVPTSTIPATPVTASLYLMLSQAGSMSQSVSGGGTRWDAATQGINGFASQPVAGTQLGVQYFGLPISGCQTTCNMDADCGPPGCGPCNTGICVGGGGDSCVAADYANPEVEIGAVPGQAGAISSSIALHNPSTAHPTSAAVQGAVDHARAWATAHPGQALGAVVILDGDPTQCDTTPGAIEPIAAAGFQGQPSVQTFIVSLATVTEGDAIADAGGTGAASVATTAQAVNGALAAAAHRLADCRFFVNGGTSDGGLLQLQQQGSIVPRVSSEAGCGANAGWWYAGADTTVLCPASCAVDAGVVALLGCP